ncbi:penicillin-binding protein activator [Pseudidiomarina gelatinasegens]|uniref:penicillin-binding protein activator n=1 Tax=Pseudidiomarina gelatinasegens TaxID=2487740 RepID=UPI003A96FDF8
MTAAIVPKKLLLCMVIVALAACSSGPRSGSEQPQTRGDDTDFIAVPLTEQDRSASSWLANARLLEGAAQVDALLQAAATFQRDEQWQQSAVVIAQVQRHFEPQALSAEQQQLVALLEARFAAYEGRWTYAEQLLQPLLTPRLSQDYPEQTLELALQAARAQRHWQQAARYQLQLVNVVPEHIEPTEVWAVLKQVTDPNAVVLPPSSQRSRLVAGWVQLMTALHEISATPNQFDAILSQWQQNFADHPGQFVVDNLTALTAQPRNQVLVLLPLTGQYQEQGNAVRDGIIKALTRQPQVKAVFIDTNQLDFAALPELLQQHQASMLLGPLLKPNVAAIDVSTLPEDLPWLTLNEPETGFVAVHGLQHFFALDTETEIKQAAAYMAQRGHRHPVVLAPATNRGQQQAELFKQAWQAQFADDTSIALGSYRNTEEMKSAVQDQLGVTTSEARIYQVKIAAGKIIVESQARSRADIDSVYLVGGIEQTRLLKPFIDVNISPFMKALPVYANSGSHTLRNDLSENDLDNVRFTEAPWLLPGHSESEVLEELLAMRTGWGYSTARLVAFGHDALLLSQRLPLLQTMPGISAKGLTGELQVTDEQVTRKLNWARFKGHEVVAE